MVKDVILTSMRCHYVASTSVRGLFAVICLGWDRFDNIFQLYEFLIHVVSSGDWHILFALTDISDFIELYNINSGISNCCAQYFDRMTSR